MLWPDSLGDVRARTAKPDDPPSMWAQVEELVHSDLSRAVARACQAVQEGPAAVETTTTLLVQPHVKRMLVLDLYCGAGGAGRGLQLAGFEVVGVDVVPQPHYPGDRFIQADAIEFLATRDLSEVDFIWASPPCQAYSSLKHAPGKHRAADLITPTRDALVRSGKPYVIENVEGARALLVDPVLLCGTMFGLKTPDGFELQRYRLFETSFPVETPECRHGGGAVIGIYGGHFRNRQRAKGQNHRSGSNLPREHGFIAMGVDWLMTVAEISDAIPPAYSRFIAEQWKRTLVSPHEKGRWVRGI